MKFLWSGRGIPPDVLRTDGIVYGRTSDRRHLAAFMGRRPISLRPVAVFAASRTTLLSMLNR